MSDLPLISVFKTFLRTHNLKQNTMYKKVFVPGIKIGHEEKLNSEAIFATAKNNEMDKR